MRHRLTRTLIALAAVITAAVAAPIGGSTAGASTGQFLYDDYRIQPGLTVHGIITNLDPAFITPAAGNTGYASQYVLLRNSSGAYLEVGIYYGWMQNSYPSNTPMNSGLFPSFYWCDEIPGVYQRWCHGGPAVTSSNPVTIGLNAAPYGGGTAVYMNGTWDFSTYLQSDGYIDEALIGLKTSDWKLTPGAVGWKNGRFWGGQLARHLYGNPYGDLGWQTIDTMNLNYFYTNGEMNLNGLPVSNMPFAALGKV